MAVQMSRKGMSALMSWTPAGNLWISFSLHRTDHESQPPHPYTIQPDKLSIAFYLKLRNNRLLFLPSPMPCRIGKKAMLMNYQSVPCSFFLVLCFAESVISRMKKRTQSESSTHKVLKLEPGAI